MHKIIQQLNHFGKFEMTTCKLLTVESDWLTYVYMAAKMSEKQSSNSFSPLLFSL